jgi:hypothetical protein
LAYWWKKLGGKQSDQFDKVNNTSHDILRNLGCFAKLIKAFEKGTYDVAFFLLLIVAHANVIAALGMLRNFF